MLTGCGNDENPQPAPPENDPTPTAAKDPEIPPPDPTKTENPQMTPQGAVKMFADGLAEYDKQKYLSAIHGDQQMRQLAEIIFDYSSSMNDFKTAFIAQYGPDAEQKFFPTPASAGMAALQKNLESMNIKIEGDKAICTVPGEEGAVYLIRKNDLWYVDVGLIFVVSAEEADRRIKMWSEVIEMIRDMQKKVGAPGVTAQALYEEFDKKQIEITRK